MISLTTRRLNGTQRDSMSTRMTKKTRSRSGTFSTRQCNNLAALRQEDAGNMSLQRMMTGSSLAKARKSRQGNNCGRKDLLTGSPTTRTGRPASPVRPMWSPRRGAPRSHPG